MLKKAEVCSYQVGLHFYDGEFRGLIGYGTRWLFDPLGKHRVDVVSKRDPWLTHYQLDLIVRSGLLGDAATAIDLKDNERALVWIDGRFDRILTPGLYAYWNGFRDVRVERVDANQVKFEHKDLAIICRSDGAKQVLDICSVNRHCAGVLFIDGDYVETLTPGLYAYWKGTRDARITELDLRESVIDVSGQEIMTQDKVTLRLNVVVTYQITDAKAAVLATDDVRQSLYRETQLVVRAVVGTRDLDDFLSQKDSVAEDLERSVRERATLLGLKVTSVGIRDVILPGEMKDLMNKVTEARKAAEANLISRREETAAMRIQANTAKVLTDNPTLMRLRELEVLEKIATEGKLNVVLGEKGLADRVTNLL